jgi:excisionase family DNA binding protein
MYEQPFYTVRQVSDMLQITEHSVYQYLRTGELVGIRRGRAWRISEGALRTYMRGNGGMNPRMAARQIHLVHFVDAKPESVCLAFPDGTNYKLTLHDARRIAQSSEIARGGGMDLDGHHLSNQEALDLMAALVSYFARVAPGAVARVFATRAKLRDPATT